ncbi:MAG: hypothetical protein RSB11_05895, partial [Oscillospiraceae bacterium]
RYYKIYGFDKNHTRLPDVFVEADKFERMKWLPNAWGAVCSIFSVSSATSHVAAAIKSVPRQKDPIIIDAFIGWTNSNGRWSYVTPNQFLELRQIAQIPKCLDNYIIPAKSEGKRSDELLFLHKLLPSTVLYPILALEFLSPLIEPLKMAGVPNKVALCLYGKTGVMKSSAIAAIHSLNGNFTSDTLPMTFDETPLALHTDLAALKDTTAVIDDYYISSESKKSVESKLDSIVKSVADGTQHRTLSTAIGAAQCNVIITAEQPITFECESRNARIINIELKSGDVNKEVLSWYQNEGADKLKGLMKDYINHIKRRLNKNQEAYIAQLKGMFNLFRNDLIIWNDTNHIGAHSRLLSTAALLFVGFKSFLDFLQCYCEHQPLALMLFFRFKEIIRGVISEQTKLMHESKVSIETLAMIDSLIASNKYICAPKLSVLSNNAKNCLFRYDKDYIYIYRQECYAAIQKLARSTNCTINHTAGQWIGELEKDGLVIEKSKNVRFGDKVCRVDVLSRAACLPHLDIDKLDNIPKLVDAA